jgi:flagellar basal-body rod protein FlgB
MISPHVATKVALFQLMSARLSWLSQRQGVLSQNIANADTPEYQPKDLRSADFTRLVEGIAGRAASRWRKPSPLT